MRIIDHPAYNSFIAMHRRCTEPASAGYSLYGGRGIKVCDRWSRRGGFWTFVEDMGQKEDKTYTLDRIDNDKNYSPENCRWASKRVQAINRRSRSPSGVNGVRWCKERKKWCVSIRHDNKRLNLGRYISLDEATSVRKDAEVKYYAPLLGAS